MLPAGPGPPAPAQSLDSMWRGLIGLGLRSILGKGRRHGVSPARNNQAALVPSSNVTHKLPRNPRMNSKIVPVLVSITHSITSFPASSLTAAEMLAWCTSSPIYFLLSIVLCSVPSVSTDAQSLLERAPLHNALTARVGSDSVSDEYSAGTAAYYYWTRTDNYQLHCTRIELPQHLHTNDN